MKTKKIKKKVQFEDDVSTNNMLEALDEGETTKVIQRRRWMRMEIRDLMPLDPKYVKEWKCENKRRGGSNTELLTEM